MNPLNPVPWRVIKFGGSSVAAAQHWPKIAAIVREALDEGRAVAVVVSALAGVTDLLELFAAQTGERDPDTLYTEIVTRHRQLAEAFGIDQRALDESFQQLRTQLAQHHPDDPATTAELLAQGELISSRLARELLGQAFGLDCVWKDSRALLQADEASIRPVALRYLCAECTVHPDPALALVLGDEHRLCVLPGFIAGNRDGRTCVLGRGGSDISAALLGTLLAAERVEICSDVPGLFSADPRRVPGARLLRQVSYREALELAAMGAKALHPRALLPLRRHRIPLWLRQTDRPELEGTRITPEATEHGAQVKAIVARKRITLIALEGLDMWQQVGFLADVFAVFKAHGLSVDLVSTSESNITITLDPSANPVDDRSLQRLTADLERLAQVEVNTDCASVSVVGLGIRTMLHRLGPALEVFEQRRIFMVSQAANDLNLSFVVESRHADQLVQQLHQQLIPAGIGGDQVFGASWEALTSDQRHRPARPAWWRRDAARLLECMEGRDAAYVYRIESVREAARALLALPGIDRLLYSMKANPHPAILAALVEMSLGIECVSIDEARHALAHTPGLNADGILYTPNFAPRAEYHAALEAGLTITLDNLWILEHWGADFAGREVFVRLDPGSGLGHHRLVRTAGSNAKFGVPLDELHRLAALARAHDIRIVGLHAHTGSGIMHPENWHRSLELLLEAAAELPDVRTIDLGGGLGVPDREGEAPLDLATLAAGIDAIRTRLGRPVEIWLEPGRYLVAQAGVLLARVTQIKGKRGVQYVGVATGMNSLIRPALYGAWHEIVNLSRIDQAGDRVYNVVGPICESGDVLGLDRLLPECREGDVLLIANAGAYGAAMASRYNLRAPAEEVILD
ncbi:MAG: bifunctional aspartate kinase/diaminopimelate decarboxylase [Wenzhouxiangellaceae bacterium]